jgi:gamma-glutamyltranspeptidase/glutathione hydrolase
MIFLHYGVGLHILSNKWYTQLSGRRFVSAFLAMLGDNIPPEWIDNIACAKRAIDIDL